MLVNRHSTERTVFDQLGGEQKNRVFTQSRSLRTQVYNPRMSRSGYMAMYEPRAGMIVPGVRMKAMMRDMVLAGDLEIVPPAEDAN